ncbi:MAG: hypothetical protein H6611_00020 [Ignavibacteriales bacterium]|nr:hypothetical protein [Halobacteriovoraceae bacterium]MCB9205703.1 hypothetical protein [Ignavibacteriales bacterium]
MKLKKEILVSMLVAANLYNIENATNFANSLKNNQIEDIIEVLKKDSNYPAIRVAVITSGINTDTPTEAIDIKKTKNKTKIDA